MKQDSSNRARQHIEQKPLHREVEERTREHLSMRRNEQKLCFAARHVVLVTGQQRHKMQLSQDQPDAYYEGFQTRMIDHITRMASFCQNMAVIHAVTCGSVLSGTGINERILTSAQIA